MIILHASAWGGRFVLWGETSTGMPEQPTRKRKSTRGAEPARVSRSRFALDADHLAEAASSEVPGVAFSKQPPRHWVAWLPSNERGALPSSPLLTDGPEDQGAVKIAPWETPALILTTEQAVAVLLAAVDRTTWGPGVVVGKSLNYWATVLRFAGALVARQRYLPGLIADAVGPTFQAVWEPVLTGAERLQAEHLARLMPHACRALGPDDGEPPRSSASDLLAETLGAVVDYLVRSASGPPGKVQRRFPSLHDQWLYALRSPDGHMTGDPVELAKLAEQTRQWRQPLDVAASAPFRLCLRLEEPEAESGKDADRWRIAYLLQAVGDPSLLVPAATAWKGSGREAAILERDGFRPREYLLSALGQAAALSPRIEASLKSAAPSGYTLDAAGAYEFLSEKAGVLEEAGFGVFLPAWWTRKGTKLRLAARAVVASPKMTSKAGLSLDEVLKFRWEVALGDETLTLSELKALAKLKTPLVKVRGRWVELNPEEIQAALAYWTAKGETSITAREAVHMALGAAKPPGSLDFEGVKASGWLADLLAQLEGASGFETLDPPDGFHGELRPYQTRGFSWLGFLGRWGFGACLADDMGLGKTIQTLALIQREWESRPARRRKPTLLICPTSVVGNWSKEAARFTPDLPVMVHHGLERARGADFKKQAAKHALVLSSYALLHRDFEVLKQPAWTALVLDEAQNIKNPQTKQAKAARALQAEHRIALTGTPVENHVGDLWSIIEFLNPGWLGTQAEFKRTFHVPIQVGRDPEAARRLQRLTAPFVLRRLKSDKSIIADLPEKLEMKVFCTLTKEQGSLYAAVVEETAERIESTEGVQRKGIVLATLMKLKQVCNHPAQFLGDHSAVSGRSGKLARLTEMLDEALSVGDRALVFTQFAEMGTLLKNHLQETFGREVLFLHGATPKAQRDRMVERFQAKGDDGPPIFILSLKAGGTGLNLTAANHVFHFDRWWNPAVENQATDRAFRIGQTRRVQVHKFVCVGTLEERIDAMIEDKKEVAGRVVGSGEAWLTKLSNKELKDLFALRESALEG
ncbi:DEAD/DEAH box helicase [Paludisphaera borealis]|uniref:RNA polymerase-associated protein RapA n=1 Tax=Paludisphaera borealis TaxID=1387353 RepID=A0A1U7CLT8_9BACT|nr:DEAD/DEAH box helicase [Paludisphaera borealis]APW59843.1 RNA polymerase-associated protein RapA [Paludisphaera borealis]